MNDLNKRLSLSSEARDLLRAYENLRAAVARGDVDTEGYETRLGKAQDAYDQAQRRPPGMVALVDAVYLDVTPGRERLGVRT